MECERVFLYVDYMKRDDPREILAALDRIE